MTIEHCCIQLKGDSIMNALAKTDHIVYQLGEWFQINDKVTKIGCCPFCGFVLDPNIRVIT